MNNLYEIPAKLLPKSLKNAIVLPNLTKIHILHRKNPQLFTSTFTFIKKYGPSIKFYNESIEFKRLIADRRTPLMLVYGKDDKKLAEFESANLEPDDIVEKLKDLDARLNKSENSATAQGNETAENTETTSQPASSSGQATSSAQNKNCNKDACHSPVINSFFFACPFSRPHVEFTEFPRDPF
eukprot:TRINITY_DN27244_c0_g1_i2.p1 TRINITY_DN27244_c0_g1~~TRINITY_DN27244_c0_g1_i2.p1  ORF type:complete len:183 (-),score=33.93 TRINITY_DN27244_c0_g1_i2:3-551(-)